MKALNYFFAVMTWYKVHLLYCMLPIAVYVIIVFRMLTGIKKSTCILCLTSPRCIFGHHLQYVFRIFSLEPSNLLLSCKEKQILFTQMY